MSDNTEWIKIDKKELEYHVSQYENPKEYTKHLITRYSSFFNSLNEGAIILDIGCGAGAVTNQFAKSFPKLKFIGIDINEKYIAIANKLKEPNSSFLCHFLKDYTSTLKIDGVICFQTISWMQDYSEFIESLKTINPDWCLITSLFYEGPVDAFIKIKDYSRSMEEVNYRESYYNIYSIPEFNKQLSSVGYCVSEYEPFQISIDIPKTGDAVGMATYTRKTESGTRFQISGPLLMSWYTLFIKSNK